MDDYVFGEPLSPRVKAVTPIPEYKLNLTFTNGEKRIFDATPLLGMKSFKPLKNIQFFNAVKVACGTIEWPNGIDYCPDTLYVESVSDDILTPEDISDIEMARNEYKIGETISDAEINWD
jgi:hypothetical protein